MYASKEERSLLYYMSAVATNVALAHNEGDREIFMITRKRPGSSARMRGRFSGRLSDKPSAGRHRVFRRTPEFYRLVVESLTEYAVLTTDKELKISSWSKGAATMFGYKESEIIDESISRLFTPEDIALRIDKSEFEESLKRGRMDDERWHVCRDGSRLWCYGLSFPLKDDDGTVRGFVKLIRDDTERKRKDDTLRESEERLRLATEVTALGTWHQNLATGRLTLSKQARLLFGLNGGGTSYKRLFDAVDPEDRVHFTEGFRGSWMKKNGGSSSIEFRVNRPDGSLHWMRTVAKTFSDPRGEDKPIRIIGTIVDVTAAKQTQSDSQKMNQELEKRVKERTATLTALNKELETFAYSASHDLRAPLRKIRAFSQAILQGGQSKLSVDDHEYFTRIRVAASRMDRLIDDILNLARVTQQPITMTAVDLSAIVGKVASDLRKAEPQRKVKFVIQRGARVHGDRNLLLIALHNLLDNAWKFTSKHPHARIEFGSKVENGQIVYFVSDDGAGFDMKLAGKLFGAFQRLHKNEDFSGTGIGLGLVERIMRRHNGRIWAEAKVEGGATFFFTFNTEDQ